MMQRRLFVAAAASSLVLPSFVRAHHGWSSFDSERPLYLEGRAAKVSWRNPHAEIQLDVAPGLKLPSDLAKRAVPAQSAGIDGPAILAKTILPKRTDKRWELELAPLTRMQAWQVTEIKPGATLSVIGYALADEKGEAVMRVEYLFVDGKAYGLRSSPT